MLDLLVKLYALPNDWGFLEEKNSQGVTIRKPLGPEKQMVVSWVKNVFGNAWGSEVDMAMVNRPISCFIAIRETRINGFACYDATALGCFGPIGVEEASRGRGTGRALLLACLLDMKLKGYAYAVIGAAGAPEFFKKTVDAIDIPDSYPGLLTGRLKED